MVAVLAGKVWRGCPLVVIGTTQATPEAVADIANISVDAARRALANRGEPVCAGWVVGVSIVQRPSPEWVEVGLSRYGDPVYAPPNTDLEEDPSVAIEPYYVLVTDAAQEDEP